MNRGSLKPVIFEHAVLSIGVVYSIFPFFWMIITSLRSSGDAFNSDSLLWPTKWDVVYNYTQALLTTPLPRFLANGVFVCGVILLLQIATALPCAYAIAKLSFRGRTFLTATVICCLAIPFQAVALPLFVGLAQLDLLNSYFALISPFAVSVFAILMLAQYLRGYPDEIIEAARLDGLSEKGILWRLILPASKPAIAAFAIFSVAAHWNDLYWPLIVVTEPDLAPPTLGVLFFRSEESGDQTGPLMAAATIVTLPLVVFFLAAQRRFVQGITMTGVK
ncbi:carbohydrate ABC transporter permease [Neorhizobium lilium]|uniref:Carbohydrate ABC transporter permease n=1 Tax=Neorhizobium lilium TaxID=2503024 RepID=A0A3S3S251_9HYPH|nr:carbohydrate ABC transporter permease [Neorhizobium lilium]RWX74846.1 carbohydrate ABC transporter permease [Neorhizobium lilium]